MPRYTIETPDGRKVTVEANSEAEAISGVQQWHSQNSGPSLAARDAEKRAATTPGFVRAIGQGFSGNWSDEIDAKTAALQTGANNLFRKVTGQPSVGYSAKEAEQAVMAAEKAAKARYASEHPVRSIGGELVGGVALPVGKFFAGAKALPQLAARGAALGAVYGGVAGAGAAEDGRRTDGATGGALAGGALGGGLPYVGAAMRKVAVPVMDAARPVLNGMFGRSAPRMAATQGVGSPPPLNSPATAAPMAAPPIAGQRTPSLRAAEAIKNGMLRDAASGFQPRPGVPVYNHGPNVSAIGEVLGQSPGPAQGMIRNAVEDARAAARPALKKAIAEGMGGTGNYFETLDAMQAARRAEAGKVMADIGHHEVTLDPNSVLALRSDLATGAIRDAAKNALASPDNDVRAAGAMLNGLHDRLLDKPSAVTLRLRDAQDISRALIEAGDSAFRAGDGARGKALSGLGRTLRTNAATPERGGFAEYGDWLRKYGDDSDNIKALELGRGVLTNSLDNSPEKIGRDLAEMGQPALDAYRKGVGEALLDTVSRKGVGAARQLMKDENYAAKVRLAYPTEEGFNAFMKIAEDAVEKEGRSVQLLGNSRTDARGAARADLNQEGGEGLASVLTSVADGPATMTKEAAKLLLKRLPKKDQSLVGNTETNAILGRALTDENEMTRLLNLLEQDRYRGFIGARRFGRAAVPATAAVTQ